MDNIRTLATSEAFLEAQSENEFANTNFLKLNLSKCEIEVFSRDWRVTLVFILKILSGQSPFD